MSVSLLRSTALIAPLCDSGRARLAHDVRLWSETLTEELPADVASNITPLLRDFESLLRTPSPTWAKACGSEAEFSASPLARLPRSVVLNHLLARAVTAASRTSVRVRMPPAWHKTPIDAFIKAYDEAAAVESAISATKAQLVLVAASVSGGASSDGATVAGTTDKMEGHEQLSDDAITWSTADLAEALRRILTVGQL